MTMGGHLEVIVMNNNGAIMNGISALTKDPKAGHATQW